MTAPTTTPATWRQVRMIRELAAERGYDLDGLDIGDLTGGREGTASELITKLLKLKGGLNGTTPKDFDVHPGMYRTPQGDTIEVVISKRGQWYAKRDGGYIGKRVNVKDCTRLGPDDGDLCLATGLADGDAAHDVAVPVASSALLAIAAGVNG